MMKVYMLESQCGDVIDRQIHTVQDVPDAEARRMIKAGICKEYKEGADLENDYKLKLKDVNFQLQIALEENQELKQTLKSADKGIIPLNRKIKSLTDELKKAKAKKTGKKATRKKRN